MCTSVYDEWQTAWTRMQFEMVPRAVRLGVRLGWEAVTRSHEHVDAPVALKQSPVYVTYRHVLYFVTRYTATSGSRICRPSSY